MPRSEASKAKDRERNRAWFAAHPDYRRKWRERNPEKTAAYSKKHEPKRRGKRGAYFKLVWDRDKQGEKARWRFRNYGVTPEQFDTLLMKQNGACAVCSLHFECEQEIQIDHCHKTKTVRGLLCGRCNRGLGHFDDDADRLRKAANYLQCNGG